MSVSVMPELVLGAPVHRGEHGFGRSRVAAEGVAPHARPGRLAQSAAGDQDLAVVVHHVAGEGEVEGRVGPVDAALGSGSDRSALVIEEDHVVGVAHESSFNSLV